MPPAITGTPTNAAGRSQYVKSGVRQAGIFLPFATATLEIFGGSEIRPRGVCFP